MQHDQIQIFFPFNPTQRLRVCVRREYVLAWCSMLRFHQFVMQHDHVLKILNLDLLTHSPGSGGDKGGAQDDYVLKKLN